MSCRWRWRFWWSCSRCRAAGRRASDGRSVQSCSSGLSPSRCSGLGLLDNPRTGFVVLGAVFLAVTGGEALYADMGTIGRKPIRTMWYCLVLPALLLNYAGQTAHYLGDPAIAENLFFRLVPTWAIYPMVLLATLATIIASQAIITGTYSMT